MRVYDADKIDDLLSEVGLDEPAVDEMYEAIIMDRKSFGEAHIVNCKDCEYCQKAHSINLFTCLERADLYGSRAVNPNDFCSRGRLTENL